MYIQQLLLNEVCSQENDNAQGVAECVSSSRDRKLNSIMPVVYDCEQYFNWFVARYNQFMTRVQAVLVACLLPYECNFPFMLVDALILWQWKTAPSMTFIVLSVHLIHPCIVLQANFANFVLD